MSCVSTSPADALCIPFPAEGQLADVRNCIRKCAGPCPNGRDFSCIDSYEWPRATGAAAMTVRVLDILSQAPIPGLTASICPFVDLNCAEPLATAVTDDSGEAALATDALLNASGVEIPTFIKLQASPEYPAAFSFSDEPVHQVELRTLSVASFSSEAVFEALFATQRDPARGFIYVLDFDCQGESTTGLTLSASTADAETVQFYLTDTTSVAVGSGTTQQAGGGFYNIPAGPVTVTSRDADERVIAQHETVVTADAVTYVRMFPDAR